MHTQVLWSHQVCTLGNFLSPVSSFIYPPPGIELQFLSYVRLGRLKNKLYVKLKTIMNARLILTCVWLEVSIVPPSERLETSKFWPLTIYLL